MSSPQERQSEIDRCLELLSPSSSDDSKFVALMLLPRLLKQDKENVILIFDAMDFKFLERLMRTESVNDESLPDFTLKTIAVNILSCFCAIDELLNRKQIHARIPTLSSLLSPNNEELTRDILRIFIRLSSVNQGLIYIVDKRVISNILNCITSFKNVEIQELALNVIYYTTIGVITLISQDQNLSNSRITIQEYLFIIFKQLSDIFRINQDKLKFDLLQFFVHILNQMSDQFVQDFLVNGDKSQVSIWIKNFRQSLLEILSSKLGNEQRDKALSLVMLLLYHFGAISLFAPITSNLTLTQISKSSASDIDNEFKFSALVVQLSCVEIRIMLDELEQGKFNERLEVMLPACYTILEKSIEYLSHIEILLESEEEVEITRVRLEPDVLLRLKGTMTETFRGIIEYLIDIKEGGISIESAVKDEKVIASIRVLSAWLAEESSLEKETLVLMPFLVDISRYCLEKSTEMDLVRILTPAFLNITSQDNLRKAFLEQGGEQIMFDYLEKNWTSIEAGNIQKANIKEILGILQVLLNIVVSEKDTFIIKNENELWEIAKTGCRITEILDSKLKSEGYSSEQNIQIILLANTLLLCLLIISGISSSYKKHEQKIIENIKSIAISFYNDQKKIILQEIQQMQIEELIYLGQQVLNTMS